VPFASTIKCYFKGFAFNTLKRKKTLINLKKLYNKKLKFIKNKSANLRHAVEKFSEGITQNFEIAFRWIFDVYDIMGC
jgi:hypothetical protein